jgi:hypothetical protein
VSIWAAPRAIVVAVAAGAIAIALCTVLTRSRGRGPLLALALLLVLAAGDGLIPLLLAVLILLATLVDLRQMRRGKPGIPWRDVNLGLTAMGTVLVVLTALPLVQGALGEPSRPVGTADPGKPDIFLVLLDGYGRSDVLAEDYGHDNSAFVEGLADRGFDLSPRSRSNYATTGLVLAGLLNGAPLSELGVTATSSTEPKDVHPLIDNNRAFDILANAGYETIAVSSGYELVSLRTADRFIDTGELNELELSLIGQTIAEPVIDAVVGDLKSHQLRARAFSAVPAVRALAAESSDRPRFAFIHLPLPHPPYVVDENCEPILGGESIFMQHDGGVPQKPPGREAEEVAMNADQAACTEQIAIDHVDAIEAGAGEDTVVIVMSDHGPESRLNWFDPQPGPIRERLRNFFAARTPGHPNLFPADVTPVNVLPILFDEYLDADLPLHEDESFFKMPGKGLVPIDVDD